MIKLSRVINKNENIGHFFSVKLLINIPVWDKIANKPLVLSLFALLLVFAFSSCKTCKCPAYSKNQIKIHQEIQANSIFEENDTKAEAYYSIF